ncbi:cytidine deaminase [Macrococcoides canis]|uniref:Cytidine deaminase n=1 Tax=Macrococcoides canis TaxID=1855823 RepID=A0AAE6X318_9STAP|nr:cytidine deaminase [Macrococcus canis]MCO4095593.1 cytidine deaminase [Macrococcus canis]QCT75012.1 cytidine deaminase [Macrococcus canis]QIH78620.1 cytidine deaminase [Macrococcus canis]QNR08128.1 cytidine deaminase [Macrococcus canis]UTH08307.1 cytidine deaminase [Macrococcus canis]
MEFKLEWLEGVIRAQQKAYAPYSNFKVGAYLITKDGKAFDGCNVENAAYGDCICAERTALVSAIADGYKPGDFEVLVVTTDTEHPSSPCGSCRQVIKELCDDDMPVFLTNVKGDVIERTVDDLLPLGFSGKDLK